MSERNNGGPAFARPYSIEVDGAAEWAQTGMTLRDYFAAQVASGIAGDGIPGSHHRPEEVARDAYEVADAMLKAREAK